MNKNLLIVGAGVYGLVAKEIAESMGCFDKIDFIDDTAKSAFDGSKIIGQVADIEKLEGYYNSFVVAIGNPDIRIALIQKIKSETSCSVVSLISPNAYVAPSAIVGEGCIIEPMAAVHSACNLGVGCLISAGAVVNHASVCCDGVHVDCNATVPGYTKVSPNAKVSSGTVYKT